MQLDSLDPNALAGAIVGVVTAWGLRVTGAFAVLVAGWVAAGWARRASRRALERANVDPTLTPFVSGIVRALVLLFVVVAVLGLFGIPTASFVAVLGAAGLAVGLAFQGTLSNFASGVMILVFRPFQVGDYVEVGGTGGTVAQVGIFSCVINTPDNIRVIVPNSSIYGQTIRNFNANDKRRIDLVIGVSYDDDLTIAAETIEKIVKADERVLAEPAPRIAVSELGDSSVNFVVRPWCRTEDYWNTRFDLIREIKEGLEAAGCSIPFPQRDVHLHTVESGSD